MQSMTTASLSAVKGLLQSSYSYYKCSIFGRVAKLDWTTLLTSSAAIAETPSQHGQTTNLKQLRKSTSSFLELMGKKNTLTTYLGSVCKFQQNLRLQLSSALASHRKQTLGRNLFMTWDPQIMLIHWEIELHSMAPFLASTVQTGFNDLTDTE